MLHVLLRNYGIIIEILDVKVVHAINSMVYTSRAITVFIINIYLHLQNNEKKKRVKNLNLKITMYSFSSTKKMPGS